MSELGRSWLKCSNRAWDKGAGFIYVAYDVYILTLKCDDQATK